MALLETRGLTARYGDFQALYDDLRYASLTEKSIQAAVEMGAITGPDRQNAINAVNPTPSIPDG